MPNRFFLLALIFGTLLSACSSKSEFGSGAHEVFTTNIHSDSSKRFSLTMYRKILNHDGLDLARPGSNRSNRDMGGETQSGDRRGGRSKSNTFSSNENKHEAIITILDKKLLETGYCRHGYIELDYSQMNGKTEITGECQESASEEDKLRWR